MTNKMMEKISGKWIFLIIAVALYLITAITNFALFADAFLAFVVLAQKIIPILVLVFAIMFLSNLFFNPQKMSKLVGESAGIRGWILSIAGGILSMGPIYMWYPLLSDLKEKGMRNGFAVAFLYNRAVKISLLPMMIYYFGLKFTVVLTFYMVLFSVINGVFVEKLLRAKK